MRNTLTQARIGFYALLVVAIGLGIGLVPVVIVLELAQPVSSWDLGNGPIAFFFLLLISLVVFLAVFIVCNVVGSIVDQVLLPQIKAIQEAVRR